MINYYNNENKDDITYIIEASLLTVSNKNPFLKKKLYPNNFWVPVFADSTGMHTVAGLFVLSHRVILSKSPHSLCSMYSGHKTF